MRFIKKLILAGGNVQDRTQYTMQMVVVWIILESFGDLPPATGFYRAAHLP